MRVLFAISILSFCALTWAALAIARHIRRTTGAVAAPPAPAAATPFASAPILPDPTLTPSPNRKRRPQTPQRHDRTYASADSGNLLDPGARAHTRPRRGKP